MQVLTHFPILKALGWALVNSMWQTAALWVIYILFASVFQNAAARHRLALLLLAAGALSLTTSFLAAWIFPRDAGSLILSVLSPGRPAAGGFWQGCGRIVEDALPYGSSLYLLILCFLLGRYGANYRRSRRLTRYGLSAMPPQFRTFASSTALQLGIRVPVSAWLSSLVDVPVTLGFLKPIILLPAAIITRLTPQQVEAILVHELAHIRRMDYFLHLVITVLEGVFFFNPFARLLIRQLKKERENCCDDLVLQFRYDPHAYVSALLSLASCHHFVQRLAVAATGTGDRMLLERAKRILLRQKGERLRTGVRPFLLLVFTALIAAMTLYRPLLQTARPDAGVSARMRTTYFIPPERAAMLQRPGMFLVAHVAPPVGMTKATTFIPQPRLSAPVSGSLRAAGQADLVAVRPMILTTPAGVIRRHAARQRLTGPPGNDGPDMAFLMTDPEIGNDFFVNTAEDRVVSADSDVAPAVVAMADGPELNAAAESASRDFSMNVPLAAGPSVSTLEGMPFVPNSSFTFQYNSGDTINTGEQLLFLQQSAQLEVLAAMARLQQQTAAEWKTLAMQLSRATESVRLRKQIRSRQLQLQEDYFKKIMSWQSKLQKSAHIRMIVYI